MSEDKQRLRKGRHGRFSIGAASLNVRLPKELGDRIRRRAAELGVPQSAWLRAVAETALDGDLPAEVAGKVPRLRRVIRQAWGEVESTLNDIECVCTALAYFVEMRDPANDRVMVPRSGLEALLDLVPDARLDDALARLMAHAQPAGPTTGAAPLN